MPVIGPKRVDEITTADVMACLAPIWTTKAETAKRVRQRISAIMKWAIAEGHRSDNPAGAAVVAALPKQNGGGKKHHRALPHGEVGDAVVKVREASGVYLTHRLAFEFLVLTAGRSAEVRGAVWSEIDLETGTWVIPAGRMKAAREHRVPLSGRAIEVLAEVRRQSDDSSWVFPAKAGGEIPSWVLTKIAHTPRSGWHPAWDAKLVPGLVRRNRYCPRSSRSVFGTSGRLSRRAGLREKRSVGTPPRSYGGLGPVCGRIADRILLHPRVWMDSCHTWRVR